MNFNFNVWENLYMPDLPFEEKIRMFMRSQRMYGPGDRILAGISGGKDSMMLAVVLSYVAEKDDVEVELLHLNFGQPGSELLEKHVRRFAEELGLPIRVWRMKDEWGITFPELLARLRGNPCGVCSTLLRYYLLYFGKEYDAIATGHNLDDIVSFMLYNAMTGNVRYSATLRPVVTTFFGNKKVRPFFYVPEERLAEEAKRRGIKSLPTGCPSEEEAPTVVLRKFLREFEKRVPGARKSLLKFFLSLDVEGREGGPRACERCGMPASGRVCAVCKMKERVRAGHG